MSKKKVTITNGKFNWILKVDGNEFTFNGFTFAEYLRDHYKKLGYEVKINDKTGTL